MNQFGVRLAQRGANIVDSSSAKYEMWIHPLIQHDLVFFQITVLDRTKRPVAHNITPHRLETPWLRLTERVKGELIETMVLNSFVRLCAGPPSWQWEYHHGGCYSLRGWEFDRRGYPKIIPPNAKIGNCR